MVKYNLQIYKRRQFKSDPSLKAANVLQFHNLCCIIADHVVLIDNISDFATSEKYLVNTKMTLGDSSEDDSDLFRILISSDIHLGYAEKDAERGLDSFNSFDELLGIGVERGVDMVTCFDDDECCLLILVVTMGQKHI